MDLVSLLFTYIRFEPVNKLWKFFFRAEKKVFRFGNKVLFGFRENSENLLVKSEEEYTSPIEKICKADTEYIMDTENSLYIVSAGIASKRIS